MDSKEIYRILMGDKEYEKYKDRLEKLSKGGRCFPSWNWGAFFFGGFWLLYRKRSGLFLIYWLIVSIVTSIGFHLGGFVVYGLVPYLVVSKAIFPCYANQVIYIRLEQVVRRIQSHPDPAECAEHFRLSFSTIRDPAPGNPRLF